MFYTLALILAVANFSPSLATSNISLTASHYVAPRHVHPTLLKRRAKKQPLVNCTGFFTDSNWSDEGVQTGVTTDNTATNAEKRSSTWDKFRDLFTSPKPNRQSTYTINITDPKYQGVSLDYNSLVEWTIQHEIRKFCPLATFAERDVSNAEWAPPAWEFRHISRAEHGQDDIFSIEFRAADCSKRALVKALTRFSSGQSVKCTVQKDPYMFDEYLPVNVTRLEEVDEDPDSVCGICLEQATERYEKGTNWDDLPFLYPGHFYRTSCGHDFHRDCIARWTARGCNIPFDGRRKKKCPTCRAKLQRHKDYARMCGEPSD